MWWKLSLLALITLVIVIVIQPVRTHAVKIDIPANGHISPARYGLLDMLSAMYVTPTSLLISAVIVAIVGFLAFRIIRS